MLLENATPILGIAIDRVPGFYNQHLGALSQKLGEVTDAEGGWLDKKMDKHTKTNALIKLGLK